jgi:integral membrane sensor domain MASE1
MIALFILLVRLMWQIAVFMVWVCWLFLKFSFMLIAFLVAAVAGLFAGSQTKQKEKA